MSEDKKQIHCGKPNCEAENCVCILKSRAGFNNWLDELEEQEQPTCNIENQEDCENCGS